MTGVASASEQLFVSRLARLSVRAPSGEMIGRIADVVIARAAPGSPPVVLGLTVWVQRRPIFIGMGRVRELDAGGATLTTGTVNLRPFELRAGETLVLGELVDSRVRHRETGREYRINDVAIGLVREGWVVCALDAIEPGSGLRAWRRPRHLRLTWDTVAGLEAGQSAESRLAALADLRPADVAAALLALPAKAREDMASELDDDRLAATLEQLPEEVQAGLLTRLDDERAADVLEAMDPDDAADLLGEMSEADRARLLALMIPEEAEPVRRLLVYDEETAGGLMTTEPVIMRAGDTVAEALARVRDPDLPPSLARQVFVVRPPTQTPTRWAPASTPTWTRSRPTCRPGASPSTWPPTTCCAHPSATSSRGCWERCPSTTCSTTCCRRPGGVGRSAPAGTAATAPATGTGTTGAGPSRWSRSDERGTAPDPAPDQPDRPAATDPAVRPLLRPGGVRALLRGDRPLPRHGALPGLPARRGAVAPGVLRRAADPAGAEPAGGARPRGDARRPAHQCPGAGRHRVPRARARRDPPGAGGDAHARLPR